MKILAIGDPHGRLPARLRSFISRKGPDAILCTGDFPDFSEKIQFRYWKEIHSREGSKKLLSERYLKIRKRGILAGANVLRQLNQFDTPVFIVHGNNDITERYPWAKKGLPVDRGLEKYSLENTIRTLTNITLLEYSYSELEDHFFYGFGCKFLTSDLPVPAFYAYLWRYLVEQETTEFRRFFDSVEPRKSIILSHDPPFGTRLDKIRWKQSPRYGEHVGDFVMKEFALKYKPLLWVCGNVHENFGVIKLGRTIVVNAGYGRIGNAAWIELNGEPRVRLLK